MNKKTKKLVANVTIVCVLSLGLLWVCSHFVHLGSVEFTDNAQVRQHIVPVNCRIQGFIKKLYFSEYEEVHQGETLALIEDMEFRFRLAQAEADYQNALAGKTVMNTSVHTTQNNIAVSDASVREAGIRLANAEREYNRYKNLLAQDAVTQQQYDGVKTEYEASKARYELLLHQKQTTALVKKEQTQRLEQTEASIELAAAAVELARLNLSYTVILAPCSGTTGRKEVKEGQLIQPGQTLVDLVDENEKWVVANYRETQTAQIREGQPVEMEMDAVPGVVFRGTVKAMSRATGASFSLIPQDNSAGNFVKVEQRIPVRIEFSKENRAEDMKRLRAGMNVECLVNY